MTTLEQFTPNTVIKGILPNSLVTVINTKWHGSSAIEVTYKDTNGNLGQRLIYRSDESTFSVAESGRPWSFDADGNLFRLISEAYRIKMGYLFDPMLAVHTSLILPLPHQITAVYGEMIPRQPLRFLLADDPGAGKTIMAGLLIKELIARGDVQKCMVVVPGSLVEQWQDELYRKFQLNFDILTNDKLETARSGNWFLENHLIICRLDKLSRDEELHWKLKQTDWDLIICDEAHKMSASYFGNEIKFTKRHRLGQLLSRLTRHFLLMSATPHNGKEEDFQLFMSLIDGDRFEGRFRDGVHVADTSDLMRRMIKEKLVKFDGKPLFPERRAYTVNYKLSDAEVRLYREVTNYVREEFNRADALANDRRKGNVGFALTILQRRLASSPAAIFYSLTRRRERLEKALREQQLLKRGANAQIDFADDLPEVTLEDFEDFEDAPADELEEAEENVLDRATAAQTIAEIEAEIAILKRLEKLAYVVKNSGTDKKWEELSKLLQDTPEMFDTEGHRRKLVIFTEHKDTLKYLHDRIGLLLGNADEVVAIQGSMGREDRRKAQEAFTQDKEVQILVATDAAGEGINLQRAHLMVNYDLPWNPNRLEQRFGRIHRIGQTEVCHLWNLVARETREGDVYERLLKKIEIERDALGGSVFDVLGKVFQGQELRRLLIEAVRYGEQDDVRARLNQVIDTALDRKHLAELIEEKALTHDTMTASKVQEIREAMERAAARKLQPHFIQSFFLSAFEHLGGTVRQRENKRYEIRNVPAIIRNRDRVIGTGEPLLSRYERITFEKELISVPGKPVASFVCPGHPLLDSSIDLILERYMDLLKQGSILVDSNDFNEQPRALIYLQHSIQDARKTPNGENRVVSQRMQFLEVFDDETVRDAGPAPFLDYDSVSDADRGLVNEILESDWLNRDLESTAASYAITELVPNHLEEVKLLKQRHINKVRDAVKDRLTKEIRYWDNRAEDLKAQEQAGKQPRMNWQKARERADELEARLTKRLDDLNLEEQLAPQPPIIIGGSLVIPFGLLRRLKGNRSASTDVYAHETKRVELCAMVAVMKTERDLGNDPFDVSAQNRGYDIESKCIDGNLRFIEVKGRVPNANEVVVTRNEIIVALNQPDKFILAMVKVPAAQDFPDDDPHAVAENSAVYSVSADCEVRYVRQPFSAEPDFGASKVVYKWSGLWERGIAPGTDQQSVDKPGR